MTDDDEAVPLGEVAQKVVDEVEAKRRCRDGGEWCKDGLCVTECHLMEKRT